MTQQKAELKQFKIEIQLPGKFVNKRSGIVHLTTGAVSLLLGEDDYPVLGQVIGPQQSKCGRYSVAEARLQLVKCKSWCKPCVGKLEAEVEIE